MTETGLLFIAGSLLIMVGVLLMTKDFSSTELESTKHNNKNNKND